MDAVHTYAAGDQVASADLNNIQAQAASLFHVSGSWRGRRPTLESDGVDVVVGPHDGFAAGTTQADAVFVPAAGRTAVSLGTLASDTFYCVYARNNAGAVAYSVEAYTGNEPNSALTHKNSGRSRVYVGTFLTNGGATPFPFISIAGRVRYRVTTTLALAPTMASSGASVAFADVDLAPWLPAHALYAHVIAEVTGTLGQNGYIRTNATTNAGVPVYAGGAAYGIETDATQKIEYQRGSAASVALYVLGYDE